MGYRGPRMREGRPTVRSGSAVSQRWGVWLLPLAALAALVLTACGTSSATSTPTLPADNSTPTPTLSAFDTEWENLKAAARQEGELQTFICCGLGGVVEEELLPAFEREFGVEVTNSTGSSSQQVEKVLAERQANIFSLDVWIGGTGTVTTRLIPAGVIGEIRSLLIHPEVLDQDAWIFGDGPLFIHDGEGRDRVLAFLANGGFYTEIAFNTNLVNEEEITSFYDLLDPRWKGKIVARDPRVGGTLNSTVYYYTHPDLGPDFLTRLFTEMDVTIVDDARQAAEGLAMGTYAFCLYACQQEVAAAREDGLPVSDQVGHLLEEGPTLSVGAGAIYAVDTPANPNAQKLFINWFLSKEGQTLMQQANGENSARVDIPKDSVSESLKRHEGVDYVFNEVQPDFVADQDEAIAFMRELLGSLGY